MSRRKRKKTHLLWTTKLMNALLFRMIATLLPPNPSSGDLQPLRGQQHLLPNLSIKITMFGTHHIPHPFITSTIIWLGRILQLSLMTIFLYPAFPPVNTPTGECELINMSDALLFSYVNMNILI